MAEVRAFMAVDEIGPVIRQLIEEAVEASFKKRAAETYLSVEEMRKLFKPAPSRPFLDTLHKKGILVKHDFGGRKFYKASEIEAAVKEIPRLKRVS